MGDGYELHVRWVCRSRQQLDDERDQSDPHSTYAQHTSRAEVGVIGRDSKL